MKIKMFYEKISFSNDLTDQLQDLADFLKEFTNSTAVYIGKLVSPKKPISDDDDDEAHIDNESPQIIHYMKATTGHEFLVDAILKQDQGLTFEVFKEDEEENTSVFQGEVEDSGEEQAPKEPVEVLPKYIHVPEVVKEI